MQIAPLAIGAPKKHIANKPFVAKKSPMLVPKKNNEPTPAPETNEPLPAEEITTPEEVAQPVPDITDSIEIPETEEVDAAISRTNTNPLHDEGFMDAIEHGENEASLQTQHEDPAVNLTQTTQASELTEAEQQTRNDASSHLAQMEAVASADRPPITPESFIEKFDAFLQDIKMPTNENQAEKFKEDKPITVLNDKINTSVNEEKESLAGPVEAEAKAEAPASNIAPIAPVELVPNAPSATPQNINAKAAVPKPKTPEEISLAKESQSLDDELANNNVTDEQLARSEEPEFLSTLKSKGEAQTKAAEAPQEYRQAENKKLQGTTNQVQQNGLQGLTQMNETNVSQLEAVDNTQKTTKESSQKTKEIIYADLEVMYNSTKEKVAKILSDLTEAVTTMLDTEIESAYKTFEENVEDRLDGFFTRGLKAVGSAIGVSEESEDPEKVFRDEKAIFERTIRRVITKIANIISDKLNEALAEIKKGEEEKKKYEDSLSEEEKKLGEDALEDFGDRYADLTDSVYAQQEELASSMAQTYNDSVDSLREKFDEIKARVDAGWLSGVFDMIAGVIATIKKLYEVITNMLSAIASAIDTIMSDPIGFMKNLFAGIKQGFDNFKTNIQKHLIGGLIEWLTGSLGPMGITVPENLFSLAGVFDLLMQILGLGWDTIRRKALKFIPEPMMEFLEKSFDVFILIRDKGVMGIWEYLKDKFNDLQETVIGAVKEMVITTVIEAGIKWVLSLLIPGAGFIKAVMAIKDVIVFFVESAIVLLPAITEAILGLASGSLGLVAKAVELGLAKIIPVVIGLLAKLLGLNGLVKKVTDIFNKIRKRVDKAIDKLIKTAQKQVQKLFGKSNKKGKAKKDDNAASASTNKDVEVGEQVNFKIDAESHKIWIDAKGSKPKLMMASNNPGDIEGKVVEWKKRLDDHPPKTKEALSKKITEISATTADINSQAVTVKQELEAAKKSDDPKKLAKAQKKDEALEKTQQKLLPKIAALHKKLFAKFTLDPAVKKGAVLSVKYTDGFFNAEVILIDNEKIIVEFVKKTLTEKTRTLGLSAFKEAWDAKEIKVGEAGEHDEYKPVFTKMEFVKGGLNLHYQYEDDKHKEKTFQTLIEFGAEAATKKFSITSSGKKIALKESGTRGKTDSSGKLISDDFKDAIQPGPQGDTNSTPLADREVHSAHLIADWFTGSGFKSAKNIVPTSKGYNTVTMYNEEKKIFNAYKGTNSNFDIAVKSSQVMVEDNSIIAALKKERAKVEGETVELPAESHAKILKELNKKEDPQYTEKIAYDVANVSGLNSLGADEDLKKWFNT